jgi:hypothetical protein
MGEASSPTPNLAPQCGRKRRVKMSDTIPRLRKGDKVRIMREVVAMGGYSAKVRLRLEVDGVMHNLSHVGGDEIILRELPAPLPPCNGVLHIHVDDHHDPIDVYLPDGVHVVGDWVKYQKLTPEAAQPRE